MRRAAATGRTPSCHESLVHNLADGARAAAALGAAAEAAIHLTSAAWRGRRHSRSHFVVAQNIAGADDHRSCIPPPDGIQLIALCLIVKAKTLFKNILIY